MSPRRARHEASDESVPGGADDLAAGAQLLESALDAGGHRLDPAAARTARQVLSRVGERSRLSGEHTVVALAGATGSGKSSLFNALTGLDIATIGVRRPTTSVVTSCTWGPDGAARLLDWLQVPEHRRVSHESALDPGDDELRGLVLLDLPDYDSTESAHRAEVDRLVELVDLFVWVTDPQKYADAALHRRYLSRLAGHDAVTLVVLNQTDRLSESDLTACLHDLERLVEADGLHDVPVIATSALTGAGVPDLRDEVGRAVHRRNAWSERLAADLGGVGWQLRDGVADREADIALLTRDSALAQALAGAAGVPAVVHAIEAHYRRGARAAGGWPFTRWVARLRPDPLRRLRVTSVASSDDAVRTARSSLPGPTPAQRARVELATRQIAEAAGEGLPDRWADAVRAAARPADGDLSDALDQAVLGTDLGVHRPAWWRAMGALQWALAAAAVAGGVWLLVLAAFGALRLPEPRAPYLGWVPVPTLLLVAGLALGALIGVGVGLIAAPAARRRADRARVRLTAAVRLVADERIVHPIESVLADHRTTRDALDALRARASGGGSRPG